MLECGQNSISRNGSLFKRYTGQGIETNRTGEIGRVEIDGVACAVRGDAVEDFKGQITMGIK